MPNAQHLKLQKETLLGIIYQESNSKKTVAFKSILILQNCMLAVIRVNFENIAHSLNIFHLPVRQVIHIQDEL